MQNKDYKNFVDEQTDGEIAVGVPVTLPPGTVPNPYFQQPYPHPHMINQQAQGYYPNQDIHGNQINHPKMPMPVPMQAAQMIAPQQGQASDYSKPILIRCPCCANQVTTVVNNESGNTAYLWAGIIFCCVSPFCVCLPFVTDKCMDKNHYCPQCGFNIVRKHRGFFDCS